MSEGDPGVTCGNCGRTLDEQSGIAAELRKPCPVCGSTTRTFHDAATPTIRLTVSDAAAVTDAAKVHVESVPADELPEAEQIRGSYRATLDWQRLEGGFWLLQVFNASGELVDGGAGDSPEDALLEIYKRLVPPT